MINYKIDEKSLKLESNILHSNHTHLYNKNLYEASYMIRTSYAWYASMHKKLTFIIITKIN